jgi:hypothetical protein
MFNFSGFLGDEFRLTERIISQTTTYANSTLQKISQVIDLTKHLI